MSAALPGSGLPAEGPAVSGHGGRAGARFASGAWTKSSRSGGHHKDECCEARLLAEGVVLLRDSADPGGPHLLLPVREWVCLLAELRRASSRSA